MIVTTLRCNHKCKYCHAAVAPMTAKEFDMSKETAKKVVDTIFYTNSPSLTIEFQ
jgi:sulfatase maturation enzyme AslB (radical SAM superfamily)